MRVAMGDELLKKTGAGNLFMVFGEPDLDVKKQKDGTLVVTVKGVDVYDPTTGRIRSNTTDLYADQRSFSVSWIRLKVIVPFAECCTPGEAAPSHGHNFLGQRRDAVGGAQARFPPGIRRGFDDDRCCRSVRRRMLGFWSGSQNDLAAVLVGVILVHRAVCFEHDPVAGRDDL